MPSFVATALVTAIALAPAAGRASAKAYPAPAILSEFGTACLSNREVDVTTEATFENWRGAALKQGWSTIRQAPPPGTDFATRAAFRAYHSIMALDYDLLSYLLATGDEQIEREVMIKTVGGRAVYLSLLVLGRGDTPILSQCRLFDPLGDGISTLPIGRAEIDSWAGQRVKTYRAPYGGRGYAWKVPSGDMSLRVHFGFAGKSRAKVGGKYDPYALYGLMLVHDNPTEIIIVT